MKLEVVSPTEHTTYAVAWLELNTPVGNFVIQEGHVPMVVTVSPNKPIIFRLKSGKQKHIIPRHGIADIQRNSATLIITQSE